jgi:hypothetical protein
MMSLELNRHQQIVKKLIDSKAVDFGAIGKAVTELGPSLAMSDDPWENFCGTMRRFIVLYRLRDVANPVENLAELSKVAGQGE